jgi:hypothetical protein
MPALDVTAQSLAVLDYDPTIPEIHSANCSRKHDTSASCDKRAASKAAFTHEEFETLVNASVPRTRTLPKRATVTAPKPKPKEAKPKNTLASAFALHATPEKIAALRLMHEASAAGKKKKMPVKAAKTPVKERHSAEKIAAVETRARAMALERYASADKMAAVRVGLEAREHTSPEKMAAVRAGLQRRAEVAAAEAAKREKVASVRLILEAVEPLVATQSRKREKMASASGFQHYTEDVSHLIQ